MNTQLDNLIAELNRVIPVEILILLLIMGVIITVWDMLMRHSSKIQAAGGLGEKSELVALKGSDLVPEKEYRSETLKLISQPHGIIKEGGFLIPIDNVPSSKKVRDRHVVQMLVHLRVIEEQEGKMPPYGILILGKEQRSVRIKNTEEKQRWLDNILAEMRSIMDGVPAVPKPTYYKCRGCDVRPVCAFSAYKEGDTQDGDDEDGEEG